MPSQLGRTALRVYQIAISPVIHWLVGPGTGCRFVPTCSAYAQEAIKHHGLLRGTALTVLRLCRCHPFARAGFDPIPTARTPFPRKP